MSLEEEDKSSKRGAMYTSGHGCTHIGRARENNEDVILVDRDLELYAVCDGMGGHAAGEVAAALAIETLFTTVQRTRIAEKPQATVEEVADLAARLARYANIAVYEQSLAVTTQRGMGCTLTFLLPVDGHAVIGHVGDSRAMLYRDGEVKQLTTDHTLAHELASLPAATRSKHAHSASFQNVLARAIGSRPDVRPDVIILEMQPGDKFLLCSDGLTRYFTNPQSLAPYLDDTCEAATSRLVEFANRAGGEDNISAVVVDVLPVAVDTAA